MDDLQTPSDEIGRAWVQPDRVQTAKFLVRGDGFFKFTQKGNPQLGLGENAYFAKNLDRDEGFRIAVFRAP